MLSSGAGLDGELFGMGLWSLGLGAVGAAIAGIFLANTDLCLPKVAKASLEYLEDADLRSITDGECCLLIIPLSLRCGEQHPDNKEILGVRGVCVGVIRNNDGVVQHESQSCF